MRNSGIKLINIIKFIRFINYSKMENINIFNKNKENDIYRELKYCKKTTSICNNLYEKISNLLFFK